jgi:hypothetical protein
MSPRQSARKKSSTGAISVPSSSRYGFCVDPRNNAIVMESLEKSGKLIKKAAALAGLTNTAPAAKAVAADDSHTCALIADGTIQGWLEHQRPPPLVGIGNLQ